MNLNNSKPFYSRAEVKTILGVSYSTLNQWNKNGILPAYKLGRKVFYKYSDIESHLISLGEGGDCE